MSVEIYGTFGPACKSEKILEEMIQCGLTGMRLNLSHTTLESSAEYIENYLSAAKKLGKEPQILIDMQGPELRIGDIKEQLYEAGETVEFIRDDVICLQKAKQIPIPASVMQALKTGMEVLLDDGKLRVFTEEVSEQKAMGKVLTGGILKAHKSVKVVDVDIPMPVLTNHDIQNLRKAKEYGVTALMQPFVFHGDDLKKVKEILKQENVENIRIFAKIENRTGFNHLDYILPEADMVVIARGDLGNDMPLWELPVVQKKIENKCKEYGKPYLVVTQMLATMEYNPVPTRAEVSDIFHAVYHGASAVMVTGETAVGKYPVEVIRYLANTAIVAEKEKSLRIC